MEETILKRFILKKHEHDSGDFFLASRIRYLVEVYESEREHLLAFYTMEKHGPRSKLIYHEPHAAFIFDNSLHNRRIITIKEKGYAGTE